MLYRRMAESRVPDPLHVATGKHPLSGPTDWHMKEWASLEYGLPDLGVPVFLSSKHSNMSIPNRGPELVGVNIAFVVTAALAYGLRAFVRIKMVKAFGFDDWLMGLALVRCEFHRAERF
jgi:hypothetical protein